MDDATQKLVDEARGIARSLRAFQPRPGEWASGGVHDNDRKAGVVDALADALEAAQRPPVGPEVREEMFRLLYDASGSQFMKPSCRRSMVIEQRDAVLARFSVPSRPPVGPEVREAVRAVVGEQLTKAGLDLKGPPYNDDGETQWPVALELRDRLTAALLARFSVPSHQQHVGDWDTERAEYVCSCGSALNAWWPDGMKISGGESAFDKWMRLHPEPPSQPVYDEEAIARLVEQQMRGAGLSDNPAEFDSSIHSWRCDRYGPCGCFQEMRNGLVAALVAALRGGELTQEETKRG